MGSRFGLSSNGDWAMKASLLGARLAMASLNSVGAETGHARGSAYTIIRFNTATGDYDRGAMDRQKFDESMRLWRAARQKSTLLNPDDQHGRQCNTHISVEPQ